MKKLYTLFALSLLASSLSATIHYTYVHEDVIGTDRYYDMDLDGDDDFRFEFNAGSGEVTVNPIKSTSSFAAEGQFGPFPKAYVKGAGMGTYHWWDAEGRMAYVYLGTGGGSGNFYNTNKYLQVQFSDGINVLHGWFEILCDQNHFYIESFAYSDVPNQTITAGQTDPTFVPTINPEWFTLAPHAAGHVAFKNCDMFDKVLVTSVDGRLVGEIINPQAFHNYQLVSPQSILVLTFYRKNELVYGMQYLGF